MTTYAHTRPGEPPEHWEPLEDHLCRVAELAAGFAAEFEAAEWGRLAGLWHDLGKYRPEFQARLRGERIHAEHAGLGAALACGKHRMQGLPLAFAIAGHHSGLANKDRADESFGLTPLAQRLERNATALADLFDRLPSAISEQPLPPLPPWLMLRGARDEVYRDVEMFTRFLFSALIDADRLSTEAFCTGDRDVAVHPPLAELRDRCDAYIGRLAADRAPGGAVSMMRAEVLRWCREAARRPRGIFRLTVPTGGGKTLSSMSFALRHAALHGHRRVIVVIPFTSIIEQNAEVYREALGPDVVVEHHCNFDEHRLQEEHEEREQRRRWAIENWDAPIIVTTTVQFFETMFSNHPSRCRKLHNVSNSVVVLDEVQTLPPGLLRPILSGLQQLSTYFRCSIVLSTATQPSLRRTASRPHGLDGVDDIVPDAAAPALALDRVRVRWVDDGRPVPYPLLASRITTHDRVLAVVHLRRDARLLAELLPAEGTFHLSALMCPAHRIDVLQRIRARLKAGAVCRVVSTQLIEAGVDVDFPVVYRALAGIDSLAQAAGRCNREGNLVNEDGARVPGDFFVFRAQTEPPAGVLRRAMQTTATMRSATSDLDIHAPATHEWFFDSLYFVSDLDSHNIQALRADLAFADVGNAFRLIDRFDVPIIVPWGNALDHAASFRRQPLRSVRRTLQMFAVQVPLRQQHLLQDSGALEALDAGLYVLAPQFAHLYSDMFGLAVEGDPLADPGALVT